MSDLTELTIKEAARLLRLRSFSSAELVTAHVERIEKLDHRVKAGKLEVGFDEDSAEFSYRDPRGGRALLELLPTPSWHEMQYRR